MFLPVCKCTQRIKSRINLRLSQSKTRTMNFLSNAKLMTSHRQPLLGHKLAPYVGELIKKRIFPACGILKSLFIAKKTTINVIG